MTIKTSLALLLTLFGPISSGHFPSVYAVQARNSEPGTWNLEPGTRNLEPGTWNLEPGTWNPEP